MSQWNVGYAKAHFSAILEQVKKEPQVICRHNSPYAVIVDIKDYEQAQIASEPTISDLLDELRLIQKSECCDFEIPERVDRNSADDFWG